MHVEGATIVAAAAGVAQACRGSAKRGRDGLRARVLCGDASKLQRFRVLLAGALKLTLACGIFGSIHMALEFAHLVATPKCTDEWSVRKARETPRVDLITGVTLRTHTFLMVRPASASSGSKRNASRKCFCAWSRSAENNNARARST